MPRLNKKERYERERYVPSEMSNPASFLFKQAKSALKNVEQDDKVSFAPNKTVPQARADPSLPLRPTSSSGAPMTTKEVDTGSRMTGWWAKRQSIHLPRNNIAWGSATFDELTQSSSRHQQQAQDNNPAHMVNRQFVTLDCDERIRIGSMNITVSILHGPRNHAIWKARLLCALKAEDVSVYGAATGTLRLEAKDEEYHGKEDARSPTSPTYASMSDGDETQRRERAHAKAVAMITSTLPDETFAMVVNQNADAFKLMEALDARFRPYPRYSANQ